MANIIVAVACNLIAAFILISGIFSALRNDIKTSLVKLFLTIGGGVGAYFLTPVVHKYIYGVSGVSELLAKIGVSTLSVDSILFLIWFLVFYAVVLMVCSIVRHCTIAKLRDKKLNSLKMKRARSINPKAEKAAERAEWKALNAKYKEKNTWWKRLISSFIGAVIAIVVGYVVLMPYGYIAKDIVAKHEDKSFLVQGYEYTLNGWAGDKIPEFLLQVKDKADAPEVPEETPGTDVETPSEDVGEEDMGTEEVPTENE